MSIESWTELGLLELSFRKSFTTSACSSSSFESTPQTLHEAVTFVGVDPVTLPQSLVSASQPSLFPLQRKPSRSKLYWLCGYLSKFV